MTKVNKLNIKLQQADCLDIVIEGMVYPTDPTLTLSPRIRQLGGELLINAVNDIGWCDVGDAVIGDGGGLKARYVIYTVPPKWGEDSARGKLANTVWAILEKAEQNAIRQIAMPPIGIGTMGYPIENCAKVMIEQIIDYSFETTKYLREVSICLVTPDSYEIFATELSLQTSQLDNNNTAHVL